MKEVTIKAYSRKGKGGKVIKVQGYSRRVGKKGVRSPKRDRQRGKELESMVDQEPQKPKSPPKRKMTQKEIEYIREWDKKAREASTANYGKPKVVKQEAPKTKKVVKEKKRGIFDKMTDSLEKLVTKYGGKFKK